MKKIILASSSPRRKALLLQIGLNFEIEKPEVDEKLNPRLKPKGNAELLSLLKAKAVADKLISTNKNDHFIILATDTFVVHKGEILGKPANVKDARKMLHKLNGDTHVVITGFTIIDTQSKRIITKADETKVKFRKVSVKEIDAYIKTGEPMDKAGAYAIQGRGAVLIERIEGDPFNVVGLPLHAVYEELKKFGIQLNK